MKKFSSIAAAALIGLALGTAPAFAQTVAAPAPPALAPAAPATITPVDATPTSPALATPVPEAPVANPYGLGSLWNNGDYIARGTLVILAIMSASTWYILVTKLIEQTQLFGQAKRANKTFWKAASVHEGVDTLAAKSPFRTVAKTGIDVSAVSSAHCKFLLWRQILVSWITLRLCPMGLRI